MAYKTLVASSATQQRWTIDSDAHTLAELKQEFRNNNIPFEGLAITEGLCTKAELTRDDAEIPVSQRTVNYNGQTYSRVFLITNARKQIASGAIDRKDAYRLVKEMNLQDAILEGEGQNYTRVKTDILEEYININRNGVEEEVVEAPKPQAPDVKTAPHPQTVEWLYTGIKSMVKENTLFTDDVAVLVDLTTELYKRLKEEQDTISESDLEDMLFDANNH